jgi:hypothetical protein
MTAQLKMFMFGKKKEIKKTLEELINKCGQKSVYVSQMPYYEMNSTQIIDSTKHSIECLCDSCMKNQTGYFSP